ncbi:sulfurtransferase TusA family protein [Candidatus Bathyarchaeota archaeon]|nr:MAG: sulfurtransferase TusA family protein [Candidatus Bathyarchaeota archaeon]
MTGRRVLEPDRRLDCIGLYCPEPVFRTRIELDRMRPGEVLEVVADDPSAEEDIPRLARRLGHELLEVRREGDRLTFLIRKRG